MINQFLDLFSTRQFMPHGHCYLWRPSLVWLNAGADFFIFLSYMAISASLAFLVFRLKEIPFQRIYIIFGIFIFACGLTHAMEVLNIWVPNYWVSVAVKLITVASSLSTAIILPTFFPKIRALVEGLTLLKTQKALRETERNYQQIAGRLQTVLDNAPIILWALDPHGIYTLFEGKEVAALGLKPGQLVGQSAFEVRKENPEAINVLKRVLKGETYRTESAFNGVWLESYCTPVRNSEGEITGAVGLSTNVTHRKQAEDAIHQNEKSLKQLTDALPQIVWIARPDGEWTYCNQIWIQYTGMAMEITLASGWKGVLHPDDRQGFLSLWSQAINHGKPFEMECRFKRASDGQYRWHLGRAQPIRDDKGVLIKWFGTCTDIQDQKEAYRKLLESETKTKAVISNASIILWSIDTNGIFTMSEGHGLVQLGIKQGERVGKSVFESYKNHPVGAAAIRKALQGEQEKVVSHVGKYWFETVLAPLKDTSGNVTGVVGASFDVTTRVEAELSLQAVQAQLKQDIAAREEAERALRASEERFRATFSQAAVGMCQVGLNSERLMVNQRLCEIVGYSADELTTVGLFHDITHPDDLANSQGLWFQLFQGKISTYNIEKRYIRKNQSVVWVNFTASVVKNEMGHPKYFITVIEDISEKVKSREAIVAMNESLEHRVEERTQELVTSQHLLAYKNKQLLKSNEELEDFAYIASHDLKEPLRGINNYSTFLMEDYGDKLDSSGKDKLQTLKRLTKRLETLIDSLLYYSRVGRSDLAVKKTDINEVVEGVIESLRPVMESSNISVVISNSLPVLTCDSVRVSEVFLNLITNAIKYNDKPNKTVTIRSSVDTDGNHVFFVEDNGIGIKPEHYSVIFRMFRRLHGREKFGGGTGVGLTVVKKIIERHGGEISVSSVEGEGTVFQFTLGMEKASSKKSET